MAQYSKTYFLCKAMQITITKYASRTQLTCQRNDGSNTTANLGPNFPFHDLAHYVVESHFGLPGGFFGQIANGRSIQELSDPEVIRNLSPEAWVAEILTRNLQALGGGSCSPEEYIDLVTWELNNMNIDSAPTVTLEDVNRMKDHFAELQQRWQDLREQEALSLSWGV